MFRRQRMGTTPSTKNRTIVLAPNIVVFFFDQYADTILGSCNGLRSYQLTIVVVKDQLFWNGIENFKSFRREIMKKQLHIILGKPEIMNKYQPLLTTCGMYVVKWESSVIDLRIRSERVLFSVLIKFLRGIFSIWRHT